VHPCAPDPVITFSEEQGRGEGLLAEFVGKGCVLSLSTSRSAFLVGCAAAVVMKTPALLRIQLMTSD